MNILHLLIDIAVDEPKAIFFVDYLREQGRKQLGEFLI
jgi:hypothetical protein